MFFYCLGGSPFHILLVSTAATSVFLTPLLGQPNGLVAHQCHVVLKCLESMAAPQWGCVCKDTGEGGDRGIEWFWVQLHQVLVVGVC